MPKAPAKPSADSGQQAAGDEQPEQNSAMPMPAEIMQELLFRPRQAGLRDLDRERHAFVFLVAFVEFLERGFDGRRGAISAARATTRVTASALATFAMRCSALRFAGQDRIEEYVGHAADGEPKPERIRQS